MADNTKTQFKLPNFRAGDTVRVLYKIVEGNKTRIQPFEGIVISVKGNGVSKTFTVRRQGADRIGVERIFPLHSPNIEKIEVKKQGRVKRAKLYYLRDKIGRAAYRVPDISKPLKYNTEYQALEQTTFVKEEIKDEDVEETVDEKVDGTKPEDIKNEKASAEKVEQKIDVEEEPKKKSNVRRKIILKDKN